jgi:hypothetical protein
MPFAALHELLYPVLRRLPDLPEPQAAALGGAFGTVPGRGDDRFLVPLPCSACSLRWPATPDCSA